jgi:uncharacterized protein YwqG/predicted DNA-binding protein (MmcQ/YjbR family)
MDFTEPLINRLRTYCCAKPGANETLTTFGAHLPTYQILGGFLDHFARLHLAETPVTLLLRCDLEQFEDLQRQYPSIEVSQKMKWNTTGWTWIEVPLDTSVPEPVVLLLVDASYSLLYEQLSEHDKQFIVLRDEPLSLTDQLARLIDLHQLAHRANEIRDLVTPAILLKTSQTEETALQPGQTKLGGLPDLPSAWAWPVVDDLPLAFLGQINLAEIPPSVPRRELPDHGMLYFFSICSWQLEDGDLSPLIPWEDFYAHPAKWSRVLYFTGEPTDLSRHAKPADVDMRIFQSASVEFQAIPSLPRASDYTRDPVVGALNWTSEEYERFNDLYFDFSDVCRKNWGYPARHQLLGYAAVIQNAVARPGTRLLCQIESDDEMDVMWGDGGTIYFTITDADLKHQIFSHVEADFQSG